MVRTRVLTQVQLAVSNRFIVTWQNRNILNVQLYLLWPERFRLHSNTLVLLFLRNKRYSKDISALKSPKETKAKLYPFAKRLTKAFAILALNRAYLNQEVSEKEQHI